MGGYADWSFCSFVVQLANVVLHIVHILQTVNMQNTPQVKGIDAQRCLFCKMLCSNDGEWFWNKGRQLHWCSHTPAPFFLKESDTLHQVSDFAAISNAIDFRDIKFEFWMPPTSWRTGGASRSRLAMPFNKWLQSVSVTSRVYCSNPAVTLW